MVQAKNILVLDAAKEGDIGKMVELGQVIIYRDKDYNENESPQEALERIKKANQR